MVKVTRDHSSWLGATLVSFDKSIPHDALIMYFHKFFTKKNQMEVILTIGADCDNE